MKIDWQWPAAVVYCVTCLTLGGLVALGRLNPQIMISLITWLIPSPWATKAALDGSKPLGLFGG